jgi:hypothetical protein
MVRQLEPKDLKKKIHVLEKVLHKTLKIIFCRLSRMLIFNDS